ncbi:MAG: protein kinase [Planctomycetales bacterium]
MNSQADHPNSGSSLSQQAGSAVIPPPSGLSAGPDTVINPESRPIGSDLISIGPLSEVATVLFPPSTPGGTQPFANPQGIVLGHFRIEHCIRSGGMGAVFKAIDMRLNRPVALKVLPPSQTRDSASVLRFRNEAQAAAQLDHENIARVYYIGEEHALHFIAFEFVSGTNVRDLIHQHGTLAPADVVNYTLQIAFALSHTSENGVVHRDIKPSNIIITPQGRAKLVDMGLARNENRDPGDQLTTAGTTLGTFDYISPEQAKDPRSVDVRSDIYSLGCTVFHMLTGEPPYPEGTVLQKLLDHQAKDVPDPRQKNRLVSDDLSSIVQKMMAADPRARYQSPEQLIRDLILVATSMGLKSSYLESAVWVAAHYPPPTFWQKYGGWLITVGALLLFVLWLKYDGDRSARIPPANPVVREDDQNTLDGKAPAETRDTTKSKPGGGLSQTSPGPQGILPSKGTEDVETVDSGVRKTSPVGPVSPEKKPLADPQKTASAQPIPPATAESPNPEDVPKLFENVPKRPSAPKTNLTQSQEPIPGTELTDPDDPESPLMVGEIKSATQKKSAEQTTAPPNTEVRATPPANLEPFAILASTSGAEHRYPTLEAACFDAVDGNVIELRFDGIRMERPIRINKKVTIRAARGNHPTLELIPLEIPGDPPQTQMVTITAGSLQLVDVNLLIRQPENSTTDPWTLFSIQKGEQLRLERVVVTLQGRENRNLTFAEFRSSGMDPSLMDIETSPLASTKSSFRFDLQGSMIRGQADLIAVRHSHSLRVSVKDCVIASSGTLIRTEGSVDTGRPGGIIEVQLDQNSMVLNGGLIRMSAGDSLMSLPRIEVTATNNIFTTSVSAQQGIPALVSMQGNLPQEDFARLLSWNGQKNFYDRFEDFWTTASSDNATKGIRLKFEGWTRRWGPENEVDPHNEPVLWQQQSWGRKPLTDLIPRDFSLDAKSGSLNPAIQGASTGGDAGANIGTLSRLPAAPVSRVAAPLSPTAAKVP